MQSVAGNQDHSRRSVAVPQHRQAGDQGFGESRTHTKRAALPGKRQCDLKSLLSALDIVFFTPREKSAYSGSPQSRQGFVG